MTSDVIVDVKGYDSSWQEITLPDVLGEAGLRSIQSVVNTATSNLVAALNAVLVVLETVTALLIDFADPLAAILDQIIQEVTDLISGLLDTGVSLTSVLPSLERPYSLQECLNLLGKSCTDKYDPNRPIPVTGTNEVFAAVTLTASVDSLDSLTPILELWSKIISTKDLESWAERIVKAFEPGDTPPTSTREGVSPNWETARLIDAFPYLKGVLSALRNILLGFKSGLSLQKTVAQLVTILERRIAYLEGIQDTLNAAIDGYLSIVGSPLNIYVAQGTGDQNTLADSYFEAANTIPARFEDPGGLSQVGIGAAVSSVAVGPSAPETLLNIFGLTL